MVNLTCDNAEACAAMRDAGGIEALLTVLRHDARAPAVGEASAALANLTFDNAQNQQRLVAKVRATLPPGLALGLASVLSFRQRPTHGRNG